MGLVAGEQRILDQIESGLRADEPHLASKYAIFARLTVGEPKPVREVIRRPRRRRTLRPQLRRLHVTASRLRAIALLPIVLVAVLTGLAVGLSHTGASCQPAGLRLRSAASIMPIMCHRTVWTGVATKRGGGP